MSQNDFSIDNQTSPSLRSDLNSALQALASLSSGPTEPTTTYGNMLWYNTSTNFLYIRNEANDTWIPIVNIAQSADIVRLVDGSGVSEADGTITAAVLSTHPTATWETGTALSERFISPSKLKAAIEQNAPLQTNDWELVSSTDVSGSNTFTQALSSDYKNFKFIFSNLEITSAAPPNGNLHLTYSNDGGSTYETTNYVYTGQATVQSSIIFGESGDDFREIGNGELTLFDPANAAASTTILSNFAFNTVVSAVSGNRDVAEAHNAIRIQNIRSGVLDPFNGGNITVYGLRST